MVDGELISYGIGTHAPSIIAYDLPEGYTRFKTFAGLDNGGTEQEGGATARAMVYVQSPYVQNGPVKIPVNLSEMGFSKSVKVRDLWLHKDLGNFKGEFAPVVPSHGSRLYRLSSEK